MLIISLFVHIQHCVVRYKTRKALVSLTAAQMTDIGMTQERQQTELSQASVKGFTRDLIDRIKKGRALL
ncbi:hypothetical protein [Marinomonas sp. GJ51-6]|uniref:hypothetical protein n=1 Tax=unclassified Marinomonas TaxID=196814 RepID=UPI002934FC0A|nr:hypothetical protein [Marinomonas sp. GJ51-6]WOD07889.1 hypothetical protein ONZ50_01565 [Marinomonas sp. GJ51-6]